MKELSILVTTYNPSDYLEETLRTLVGLAARPEVEVIVGDDGSTETEYLDRVRRKFEPLGIRFETLPHGGLSMARRRLFRLAEGEYVAFCDDDDYYAPDAFDYMLRMARKHKVPLVAGGRTYDCTQLSLEGKVRIATGPLAAEWCLHQTHGIHNSVWGKLYRADFLKDWIHFMPEGKLYEDLAMVPPLMTAARKVVLTTAPLYFYRMRPGSLLHTVNPNRADVLDIAQDLTEYFSGDKRLYRAACDRAFGAACNIYLLFSSAANLTAAEKKPVLRKAKEMMRMHRSYSLFSRGTRLKNRIGALLPPFLLRFSGTMLLKNL